jgi:hypothetical protein
MNSVTAVSNTKNPESSACGAKRANSDTAIVIAPAKHLRRLLISAIHGVVKNVSLFIWEIIFQIFISAICAESIHETTSINKEISKTRPQEFLSRICVI